MALPLPRNLKIDRDLEEEKDLLEKAKAYLDRGTREGIHGTDLLDLRLAYFRQLYKTPLPDRLVNTFLVGQVAHAIVEIVKGKEGDYTTPDVGTKLYKELRYSPDFLNFKGEPDEIKTTRSFYLPKVAYLPDDDTFHMYLEQLMIYMAAEDKTKGRLTLLYLNAKDENGRTSPAFYVWTVETSPDALAAYRKVVDSSLALLSEALGEKDHSKLPLCRAWKCRDCEFFSEICRPEGRYGVDPKLWLTQTKIEKERDAKKGARRLVK